ncbi:DUF397 domain-containing protein [Actinoplanes sp. ATCC 53533]|uniref:DUF397 domain-containing protein n=1 Tax=Actinoplanes sp. ATCC 53533 TaxID=1288362 RepID=UPI000F7A20B5|nr:DUF397 domain-containing protein [Actinoplanes sp. ATCC 53533]
MQIDPDMPLHWIKRCADTACIEVAQHDTGIHMRDSKDPDGPVLTFTGEQWVSFTAAVAAGEFDRD